MADFAGHHIPGTGRVPIVTSGDDQLDKLMDSMHSDGKNRERMARAEPLMEIITTPQIQLICTEHFIPDKCESPKLPFEDVEKEMDAMNRLLMECAIPFMRAGTDSKALKAPLEWVKKVADFRASVTNTKKELTNYHSGDIYELAKDWAERVGSWKTNDILPGWAIWIKSWRGEDVSPAYNVWINQISPMQQGMGGSIITADHLQLQNNVKKPPQGQAPASVPR